MKRNENIVPLSRDHHFGLLCAWKIRKGLKSEVEINSIRDYAVFFWDNHLLQHFKEEEEILIPYQEDAHSQRIIVEHRELAAFIGKMREKVTEAQLIDFADLLDRHIRFEEREWFPHLEQQLSAEELVKIGQQLDAIHEGGEDLYEDVFWK